MDSNENNTLYLELYSELNKLKQELLMSNQRIRNLETQLSISESRINILESEVSKSVDEVSLRINKQFFENNLSSRVFKKQYQIKCSNSVSSILAYGDKNLIVGGEKNFIVSYIIGQNNEMFEYNTHSQSYYNVLSIVSMKQTEINLFATLEVRIKYDKALSINLLNTKNNYSFQSLICIRKLNQKEIIKTFEYEGKISRLLSIKNKIVFDLCLNYSSSSDNLSSSSIGNNRFSNIFYLEWTKEIREINLDNPDSSIGEMENKFLNLVDMDIHESIPEVFELVVANKSTISYFSSNSDYTNHSTWKDFALKMQNVSENIISVNINESNKCYTGHSNTIYLWQMNPRLEKLRSIPLQSQFISMRHFDYLASSCIVVTESEVIFIVKDNQKIIKAEKGALADLIDYKNDSNKMKLVVLEKSTVQVYY